MKRGETIEAPPSEVLRASLEQTAVAGATTLDQCHPPFSRAASDPDAGCSGLTQSKAWVDGRPPELASAPRSDGRGAHLGRKDAAAAIHPHWSQRGRRHPISGLWTVQTARTTEHWGTRRSAMLWRGGARWSLARGWRAVGECRSERNESGRESHPNAI
jgi:hypothetical protein